MIGLNLKKTVPAVLLAALLIWGIYDISHKNNISNDDLGKNNINTKAKVDKTVKVNTGIEEGNLAPDFELTTLDGKQVRLSDYRGKKVILNFWATWCPPCKAEVPDLEKFYSTYKDKGIVILGVNLTQAEKNQSAIKAFVKSYGITYTIPLDVKSLISGIYQVSAIPTSYIIDSRGIISKKVVGPMDFKTMKSILANIN
jgi:peroxiredoxin